MTSQEYAFVEGFVKRASEYGLDENQAVEMYKSAHDLGPIEAAHAAAMVGSDAKLKGMEYNKEHHPGHYYLNPLVPGPLNKLLVQAGRRRNAAGAEKGHSLKPAIFRGNKEVQDKARTHYKDQIDKYEV